MRDADTRFAKHAILIPLPHSPFGLKAQLTVPEAHMPRKDVLTARAKSLHVVGIFHNQGFSVGSRYGRQKYQRQQRKDTMQIQGLPLTVSDLGAGVESKA